MPCDCEFTPYETTDEAYGEESWHYERVCLRCNATWQSTHCPHDGIQNPCPNCGFTPLPVIDTPKEAAK